MFGKKASKLSFTDLPDYTPAKDKTSFRLGEIRFNIEADRACKLRITMQTDPTSKAVGIVLGASTDEHGRVTLGEGDTFEVSLPIEFSSL